MKSLTKLTTSLVALLIVFLTLGIGTSAATEGGILKDTYSTKTNTNNLNQSSTVQPMDPVFGTCNIPWTNSTTGFVKFTSQVSSTPTFSWGLQLNPSGVTAIGDPATVSMTKATLAPAGTDTLRTLYPGSLYGPHTEAYPYNFHGSFSSYNYVGSSTRAYLNHGDILNLTFMIDGAKGTDFTSVECQIP